MAERPQIKEVNSLLLCFVNQCIYADIWSFSANCFFHQCLEHQIHMNGKFVTLYEQVITDLKRWSTPWPMYRPFVCVVEMSATT